MKKLCLIGGLGLESTVEYYKLIISKYRELNETEDYPEFVINSLNINKLLMLVENREYEGLVEYLSEAIDQGHKSGANYGAISANTPHIVFDKLNEESLMPLISIVEATAKYASNLKIKKIALLGTKFTMREDFFKDVLGNHDIECVVPSEEEQEYIYEKIRDELEEGIFALITKNGFLQIIDRMIVEEGVEGVILGCTELPLLLSQNDDKRIRFLDTVEIHVSEIVKNMRG